MEEGTGHRWHCLTAAATSATLSPEDAAPYYKGAEADLQMTGRDNYQLSAIGPAMHYQGWMYGALRRRDSALHPQRLFSGGWISREARGPGVNCLAVTKRVNGSGSMVSQTASVTWI